MGKNGGQVLILPIQLLGMLLNVFQELDEEQNLLQPRIVWPSSREACDQH